MFAWDCGLDSLPLGHFNGALCHRHHYQRPAEGRVIPGSQEYRYRLYPLVLMDYHRPQLNPLCHRCQNPVLENPAPSVGILESLSLIHI